MINVKHNAGFFSCCSIRLHLIVDYINKHKQLPEHVDSTKSFNLYKIDSTKDVTFDFFKNYNEVSVTNINNPIKYHNANQWNNYCLLDYKNITPLIEKYFTPSEQIIANVKSLENKYCIVHDNTLAVYYRGTDKFIETHLAPFEDFYDQILKIVNKNENIRILVQSDSAPFIDFIKEKQLKNIFIIDENKTSYKKVGIHIDQSPKQNYYDMLNFLSTIIIISKCKHIICSSGNCSIWAMLYRGHSNNIHQCIDGHWKSNK